MTVIWQPPALEQLANYYVTLSLDGQRSLPDLIQRIDSRLETNGWFLGESRDHDNRRVWFVGPFALGYDLRPGGRIHILHVGVLRNPTDDP